MKKIFVVLAILVSCSSMFGAGSQKIIPLTSGASKAVLSTTYANSQVDTVIFAREGGLSGLAFAAHFSDSVKVTSAVLRHIVDGEVFGTIATADTLTNFAAFVDTSTSAFGMKGSSGAPSSCVTNTVTLTPLGDAYWVIVTYAASLCGTGTPTVKYELVRQYSH